MISTEPSKADLLLEYEDIKAKLEEELARVNRTIGRLQCTRALGVVLRESNPKGWAPNLFIDGGHRATAVDYAEVDDDVVDSWPVFEEREQALRFAAALSTILKLKRHRLAVPINGKGQYAIVFKSCYPLGSSNLEEELVVIEYLSPQFKLSGVSPVFTNKFEAEQAIKDIGHDRIVEAFRVFHGLF